MFLYIITFKGSKRFYIGITNDIKFRLATHRYNAHMGGNTPLYFCMRKYWEDWEIVVAYKCKNREEANHEERFWISFGRENGWPLLNVADGGEGGFVVPENKRNEWKAKLSKKRQNRKPALGMKHTKKNKRLFSQMSREYWDKQDTYNAEEVTILPFKEAKKKHGISKTHYYRLKRQSK